MSSYSIQATDDGSGNFNVTVIRAATTKASGGTNLTIPVLENNNAANPLAITGATNASPIVITVTGHPYATGDVITITNVGGNTAANGTWVITKVDANSFSLTNSTGNAAYTSNTGYSVAEGTTKGLYTAIQAAMRAALDDRAAGN